MSDLVFLLAVERDVEGLAGLAILTRLRQAYGASAERMTAQDS